MKGKYELRVVILIPVASELLTESRRRQCRVPTQNDIVGKRHCRLRPIIPVLNVQNFAVPIADY
ncbi:hypothetical protein [Tychonema sp. BBK16]|uniref:hypothetical protein n=1 Tax=Tychonema sp. BBK16 TaxID=2699888 RepID=UPI001F33E044|nr:hypothetical protein [Tychonema sp. BBK16]MCF6373547.1 hypothetical protein [Tychonema sp. BBK16]